MTRRAFTLIELLTVIAISVILFGLILIPLIQSFNLTRNAQSYVNAQSVARSAIVRIVRDIASGQNVRDNAGIAGAVAVVLPGANGDPEEILLPFTKLDIVLPAEGDPSDFRDGAYVNPDTGRADPTLAAPKGAPILPAVPGVSLVRYFVGLRQPLAEGEPARPAPYVNPYDGLLMARTGERDNLYVIYRAEVPTYVRNAVGELVPNTELFDFDAAGRPILDDPFFFTLRLSEVGTTAGELKARRIRAWQRNSVMLTDLSRFDSIQPVYDRVTRQVVFDGNVPRVIPLVQFKPTSVEREAARPMEAVRLGEESDTMATYAADSFRTRFGGWSTATVRHYSFGPNQTTGVYRVMRANPFGYGIYVYEPNAVSDLVGGTEVFDLTAYEQAIALGVPHPFAVAIGEANSRSGWLNNVGVRNEFAAFTGQARTGRILSSFGIDEFGAWVAAGDANWPTVGTGDPVGPEGAAGNPNFTDSTRGINNAFNKHYLENPTLRPLLHRFVDLRVVDGTGGLSSPLHPDPARGFARARIVPGSEIVVGPDQNPGPNFGRPVRYVRTTREPGPNQYRINYGDLPEPDYALFGLANPPAVYDPNNFVSAVFQPRFRAGYLQLNSDPSRPLPSGNLQVYYRLQFNGPSDVMEVDYDTREVMTVTLSVRTYSQSTAPEAQTVTLSGTGVVRNFMR